MGLGNLPEDHPLRLQMEAANRANKKLDAASERLVDEYNDIAFDQNNTLRDEAADEAEFRLAIYALMKIELIVTKTMSRLQRYQHPSVLRYAAKAMNHKADCVERMNNEMEKARKEMNDELAEGDKH